MSLERFFEMYDVFRDSDGYSYHVKARRGELNGYLLTCGSPERVETALEMVSDARIVSRRRGLLVGNGYYRGTPVTVFTTGIGPSSAEIVFTEVLLNVDFTRFRRVSVVRAGTCGSWQPHVKPNDLVIERGVVRDESVSSKIAHPAFPIVNNDLMSLVLIETAYRYGVKDRVWIGPGICKDALYADESPDRRSTLPEPQRLKQRSFENMGALSTSMESSALSALATYYTQVFRRVGLDIKVEYGCILLVVSPYYASTSDVEFEVSPESEKDMVRLALESLHRKRMLDEKFTGRRKDVPSLDGEAISWMLYHRLC